MKRQQILLVEDDVAIMETLTLFLRYEGYEVFKASSVEQAIGTLSVMKPDLVLLDYMLQDDTAESVVELLRQKYADEVVVILLTAADDPEGKAGLVGADSVVAKPFELDVLLKSVKDSLESGAESLPEHLLGGDSPVFSPV